MNDTVESYDDSSQATKKWRARLKAARACHSFTLGGPDGAERGGRGRADRGQ